MTSNNRNPSANHIIALFPELNGIGGIQEAGRLSAAALSEIAAARDCPFDFLSLNDSPGRQSFPWGSETVPFLGFGRAKARFAFAAIGSVRRGARIVLAVHPHLALPAAQMKLFQPDLKLAVISHGVEVWRRLPFLRRRAFLAANLFLAPSSYTLEQIVERQGAPREKTKRIAWPLGPNILSMADRAETLPRPANFPEGLVVLAVARLAAGERYKGVDQLIRAVAQLAPVVPNLHLVVVGGGDDLARHRTLATELTIPQRVHFLEVRSREEVAACYAHCDVFALPSTGEGFGFVFLEALAFGKPVIGAAVGGVTDIVEDGANGLLVPPGDLSQLGESLKRLLLSESLRGELGRCGADLVRAKYRFETFRWELEHALFDCMLESEQAR